MSICAGLESTCTAPSALSGRARLPGLRLVSTPPQRYSQSVPNRPLAALPTPPVQSRHAPAYPRVISQRLGPTGTVRVTFSLPGLRRATVNVPYGAWAAGEHLQLSQAAHDLLCATAGPPA